MKFITMGSIPQFNSIVRHVRKTPQYIDEGSNSILNKNPKLPIVEVTGTEKIHGSNSSYVYTKDVQYVQSRNRIITTDSDNAGCASMIEPKKEIFNELCLSLIDEYNIDLNKNGIVLYMEFCGGNIQRNSCVSSLDKMFIIFRYFKVFDLERSEGSERSEDEDFSYWLKTLVNDKWISRVDDRIHNIMNFPNFTITIDFNEVAQAKNKMYEYTHEVEDNSGVANSLNNAGAIGEGIVWDFIDSKGKLLRWKTKGEKHNNSRVKIKTIKPVDSELENKKIKFVQEVCCTRSRLEQMYYEIINDVYNGDELLLSNKDIGYYLKLINKDVIKEESSKMEEQGLNPKQLNHLVSKIAKDYFIEKLNL